MIDSRRKKIYNGINKEMEERNMAVKIRLTRMGAKKRPSYRIVASDSRVKRDGKYLELIGTYNPIEKETKINEEIALKWLSLGGTTIRYCKKLI